MDGNGAMGIGEGFFHLFIVFFFLIVFFLSMCTNFIWCVNNVSYIM